MVPAVGSGIIGDIDAGKRSDNNEVTSIPGKVIQNIEVNGETKTVRSVTLQKTLPLQGDGYTGLTNPTNQEQVRFRYCKVYANDMGHSTSYKDWGITSREMEKTGWKDNVKNF